MWAYASCKSECLKISHFNENRLCSNHLTNINPTTWVWVHNHVSEPVIRSHNSELRIRTHATVFVKDFKNLRKKVPYFFILIIYYLFDKLLFFIGFKKCSGRIQIRKKYLRIHNTDQNLAIAKRRRLVKTELSNLITLSLYLSVSGALSQKQSGTRGGQDRSVIKSCLFLS